MMLDSQIDKVLDNLTEINSVLVRIKEVAEKNDKDIVTISRSISDCMHQLEFEEDLSDENAARIAKTLAQKRRERRELKNFVEKVTPLLNFYATHRAAMDELDRVVKTIAQNKQAQEAPVYMAKTEEGQSCGVAATAPNWKPPRPVNCVLPDGSTCYFGSVGACARAFNYDKRDIFDCCYGNREDIDGIRFEFASEKSSENTIGVAEVHKWQLENSAPEEEKKPHTGGRPKRPVRAIGIVGDVHEFESISAAAAELGMNIKTIHSALTRNGCSGGYEWEYIEEEQKQ